MPAPLSPSLSVKILSAIVVTVDSTVVTVADPIFTLGANAADSKDRGVAMKYGAAAKFSWMGMDDTDKKFKFIEDATNTGEVMTGSLGDAAFGNIEGKLVDGNQDNISQLGTITDGTWNADIITSTYGGFGIDTSGSTGVGTVSGGTWSVQSEMPVALGGTGLQTITSGCIVLGAGTADMTVLTKGTAGQLLKMNSGATAPEWAADTDTTIGDASVGGDVTGTIALTIAADAVSYAILGVEFTTAAALSGTSVDWATATTFTKTLGANTTLTFANVSTGMQVNLVISGNYTLTLPTSVKELTNASTYDGTGENLISIVSTNGNTEQFATINKVA